MTSAGAQVTLSAMFLVAALLFSLLGYQEMAVGLIGALCGQGASTGVSAATNGNGGK